MPAGSKVHGGVLPPPLQPLNPGRVPEGDPREKHPLNRRPAVFSGVSLPSHPGLHGSNTSPVGNANFWSPEHRPAPQPRGDYPGEWVLQRGAPFIMEGFFSPLGALPMLNTSPLPERKKFGLAINAPLQVYP